MGADAMTDVSEGVGRPTFKHDVENRHLVDGDVQTGMALAMVTAEPGGKVLERFEFAAIRYRDLPPLEVGQPAEADDGSIARGRGVIPGYFVVAENHEQGVFVVSDGWATASVFIEPLPPTAPAKTSSCEQQQPQQQQQQPVPAEPIRPSSGTTAASY